MAKQNNTQTGQLRIIAGRWRGRKLAIPNVRDLRPTPDRIRETVFNWLQPVIGDARCLDLFSGSGALGFEAASRGANSVTMVEVDAAAAKQLTDNCTLLATQDCQINNQTAQQFLSSNSQQYDIVFIDPPYQVDLYTEISKLLVETNALVDNAYIYLESSSKADLPDLPNHWQLIKDQRAGEVRYCLLLNNLGDLA